MLEDFLASLNINVQYFQITPAFIKSFNLVVESKHEKVKTGNISIAV